MVVRILTGAHYGLKDWLVQRITSITTLVLEFFIFIVFFIFFPHHYKNWQQFFSYTIIKVVAQMIVLSIVIHAWISIRDMWMDYIKNPSVRLFSHTATLLWLTACLIYSITIIWGE